MASLIARVEALEAAADLGRKTRVLWRADERDDIEAAIAAMVAAGARADDRFISIGWRQGGPERPMAGDRFGAAPVPSPPPVPWLPAGSPLEVPAIVPLNDNWDEPSWFWGRDWTCDT